MKANSLCSMRFHLLVPGGRWSGLWDLAARELGNSLCQIPPRSSSSDENGEVPFSPRLKMAYHAKLRNRARRRRSHPRGPELPQPRAIKLCLAHSFPDLSLREVPHLAIDRRAACARAAKSSPQVGPRPPCRCAYFKLPGWVADQGAVAALPGGAARCEKKRFSVSPPSNTAEASTRIRPVGLVAGCADETL
jgi:hypothetical protein